MKNNLHIERLWINGVAPDEPDKFEKRLAWDGLTIDSFQEWLENNYQPGNHKPSSWQDILQDCCEVLKQHWDYPLLPYDEKRQQAFVDLWLPICKQAVKTLETRFKYNNEEQHICRNVFHQLSDSLMDRLCAIGDQALWEKFCINRRPGAMLLAHLGASGDGSGPPVREYYEAFIRSQRCDGLASLLNEFPVLGRFIGTVVEQWYQHSYEMLYRISKDRRVLEDIFCVPINFILSRVEQGLSDPHRGGRGVVSLLFSDPDGCQNIQVIYKPKDLGLDAAYQDVLKDLTSCGLPPLRTLAIYSGSGYGYMEYVPHCLCANEHELHMFYHNAGRLTAVLHLLGCTDCHHENLIACGEQLLLVDTETLLEPIIYDHISNASLRSVIQAASSLQDRINCSVLRSGLLPQWIFVGAARKAVDISALGISPPLENEHLVDGWLGINSDGMMPGRLRLAAEVPTSLPVGAGVANPFSRFLDAFCEGFRIQSRALIEMRETWTTADGVLNRFDGMCRRIVLRPTRVYYAIQRQQLEPSALRSSTAQALKLELLARSFLVAESKPLHWPVFHAELQQMQQLDIPYFSHTIDGDSLELEEMGEILSGFIQESGLTAAYQRFSELNDEEITFQLRMVRGAAEAHQLRATTKVHSELRENRNSGSNSLRGEQISIQAVKKIISQLLSIAIWDGDRQVDWLGIKLGADGESFSYGPVGLSLYDGSIGVSCLLHFALALDVHIPRMKCLQEAILRPLRDLTEPFSGHALFRWWRDQPLGLNGCGGVLLALQEIQQQELAAELIQGAVPRFFNTDRQLDIIGGCAGLIGPLLRLGTETALELAMAAGDHLLAQQDKEGAWIAARSGEPLLGFSHGTAGYAAALGRLHAATGEERFREAATAALIYERLRFSPEHKNWPDFTRPNSFGNGPRFVASWCHGATGVALGRACLWGTELWDEHCEKEIAIGLETSATTLSPNVDHLCCGTLGLMVLLEALCTGPWPINEGLRARCKQISMDYRQEALLRCMQDQLGLRCFSTQEGMMMLPGFFSGLSGMGMALLEHDRTKAALAQLISVGLWPSCLVNSAKAQRVDR